MEKLIQTYPEYFEIYSRYIKGHKVKNELDELYKTLFTNVIIPNYYELMYNINVLVDELTKIYFIDLDNQFYKLIPLIDYIEFIFGNVLYETFLFELNKITKENINLEQINIFKYIITVELEKFSIYKKIIVSLDLESKFLPVMIQRSKNCELKISLCLKKIIEHSNFKNIFIECNNFIKEKDKDIEVSISKVKNYNSFIKLGY